MKIHLPVNSVLFFLQILAAVFAGFFVFYSITDADIFWHLAAGREIITHKAFLYTDPFSFTTAGRTWINLHWFFQVIMYALHGAGGTVGLIIVKSIAVAAAAWLLFSSFPRGRATVLIAFVFAIIIYGQRYLVPLRPTIMTLLAISAFISALERYCVSGKLRYCVLLVVVQIVWVNSQGLYMIGPAIAAAYAAGEWINRQAADWRPSRFLYRPVTGRRQLLLLAALPVVLIAASLLNPYGGDAIGFSFRLLRRITPTASNIYSGTIAENMPLFSMPGTKYGHYTMLVGVLTLLLIITSFAARRQLRFAHYGLAGMGLVLAGMAQRNGILFTFFIFPAILHAVGNMTPSRKRSFTIAQYAASILVVTGVLLAAVRHTAFLRTWPHTVSPFSHPVGTADYIGSHPFSGNLFNADRYGGYLLWKLFPQYKVSSDTRLTLRSDAYFREYMRIIADPMLFNGYARRLDISRVALPLAPLSLYRPLAKYLYDDPMWKLVYTDGTEALFATSWSDSSKALNMNSTATIDRIAASLKSRYSSPVSEEAFYRLLQWCAFTESFAGAQKALTYCSGSRAKIIHAAIKAQQGFYDDAERILVDEVAAHPSDKYLQMSLIHFYINNGHIDKALGNLSILLKNDPFYRPGRKLLFTLSKQKRGNHE